MIDFYNILLITGLSYIHLQEICASSTSNGPMDSTSERYETFILLPYIHGTPHFQVTSFKHNLNTFTHSHIYLSIEMLTLQTHPALSYQKLSSTQLPQLFIFLVHERNNGVVCGNQLIIHSFFSITTRSQSKEDFMPETKRAHVVTSSKMLRKQIQLLPYHRRSTHFEASQHPILCYLFIVSC